MGLKNWIKQLVADTLRPWLLTEVFPVVNLSTSELSIKLPPLQFNMDVLNDYGMTSSPLIIKGAMKVESLEVIFNLFRRPVLSMVVRGWHVVMEPRSTKDEYWEKKREKTADQKQVAALMEIDPQGVSVHTAAEGLAEGKADSSLIGRFIMSLLLASVRLEFHDCSLSLVSHVSNECQHVCHIPLSSLEFGDGIDNEGYTWSGGMWGAIMAASRGAWSSSKAAVTIDCFVNGLGLQLKTETKKRVAHGESREELHKENGAAEIDEIAQQYRSGQQNTLKNAGMTSRDKQLDSPIQEDSHVVLLEDLVLGLRFRDLGLEGMEFDAPEAAFAFDFEELHALQILTAQIGGPAEESRPRPQKRCTDMEFEDGSHSERNPRDLWKRGIQKAMELSSHRRLAYTLQKGISRRRYSTLYQSWLFQLGWGQRNGQGAERERSKSQLERLKKLSEEISETQKDLPLEAIALARRVARHHVLAALHSTEEDITSKTNLANQSAFHKHMYLPFQAFLSSFLSMVAMVLIYMQSKALGFTSWFSAARGLGVSEWKSISGPFRGDSTDADIQKIEEAAANTDAQSLSRSLSRPDSSSKLTKGLSLRKSLRSRAILNYFQLLSDDENDESGVLPADGNRWTMEYCFKIRHGSITIASVAQGLLRRGDGPRSKGEVELDSVLIPAFHLTLEKFFYVYGSNLNDSGTSLTCGRLEMDLLSILPSHLPKDLSAKLDRDTFHKEFTYLGRWASRASDRNSILLSSPCPLQQSTRLQTISEVPLANGMYQKHWMWQDRQLEVWGKCWPMDSEEQPDGNERPCLIAEYDSLSDEPGTDDDPVGLVKCCLSMGQLHLTLKGSYLPRIKILYEQYSVSPTPAQSNIRSTMSRQQCSRDTTITLEKFWDDNHKQYLDMCRESMIAYIPEGRALMSVVIDGPEVRLFSTASEIADYQQEGQKYLDMDANAGASVVVNCGLFELALWPPEKREEVEREGSPDTETDDWWSRAAERKVWVKRPPAPAYPLDFEEKRYLEHEQVGNNLYIAMEDVALILELQEDGLKELPIVGPLALVIESSLCRDQYSSLFNTSKSVSSAVSAKISSLSVQSYISEVSIILQVFGFYADALKSIPDSTGGLSREDSSSRTWMLESIPQEDTAFLKPAEKPNEVPLTACALTFSFELERLRFVLGDSRQEKGYLSSSKSASGKPAQKRDMEKRYEPREKFQSMEDDEETDAYSWEQHKIGADIGREAYVHVQDVLLHVSLGDEEQFCFFSGAKDVLMRLVDSGSASNSRELAEIRSHFFRSAVGDTRIPFHLSGNKSFSKLVLTEVSLDYLSLKAFGPSASHQMLAARDFQRDGRVEDEDVPQTTSMPGSALPGSPHSSRTDVTSPSPLLKSQSSFDGAGSTYLSRLDSADFNGHPQKILRSKSSFDMMPINHETGSEYLSRFDSLDFNADPTSLTQLFRSKSTLDMMLNNRGSSTSLFPGLDSGDFSGDPTSPTTLRRTRSTFDAMPNSRIATISERLDNAQNANGHNKYDPTSPKPLSRTKTATGSRLERLDSGEIFTGDPTSPKTPLSNSKALTELNSESVMGSPEQRTPGHSRRSHSDGLKSEDEERFLAAEAEVGKILVTDGSLDALVAKVALVANGAESMRLEVGVDREFGKIFLGTQGGLILAHTGALATLAKFLEDVGEVVAKPAGLTSTSVPDVSREGSGDFGNDGYEEIKRSVLFSSAKRSSSVPAPSTEKKIKKFQRTLSAPPKARNLVAKHSTVAPSPIFGGAVFSKISGFSLVLARHTVTSTVPAEGVLFELEVSSMFEVGKDAKRGTFDLSRFTILGMQARVPGNSKKKLGRSNSRTPQFGSSFKLAPSQSSVQGISKSTQEVSETDAGSLPSVSEKSIELPDNFGEMPGELTSPERLPDLKEEEIVPGDAESSESERAQPPRSISRQAEGFQKSVSEFNSYILERLSLHCAVEKVSDQDKVWKWTDAWQGQCSIGGLDVAITTSEIQMLQSLFAPLSNLGGSSGSISEESVAQAPLEESREDEGDLQIPDGAIIAIKDVREHCYLAAEEVPNSKGSYRLVGVLHYSLAGDRALFKVKYQDKSKMYWFSLLSVHAKRSNGEPFRVHYRPGFGLAAISSTNDGSWEHWHFQPVESSNEGHIAELDIRNPTFHHLLHLVNKKSKSGIAFEDNVPVMVQQPGNPFKVKVVAEPPKEKLKVQDISVQTEATPLPLPPLGEQEAAGLVTAIPHVTCTFDTILFTILHEAAGGSHLLPLLRLHIPGTEGVVQVGLSKTRTIFQCNILLEYYETQSSLWVPIVNPIETDVFYRARGPEARFATEECKKTPVSFFSRFRKVDFVISEPSLDACLFLIGVLELAGPYTVRYSPVRANRCLVENHTGVDLLCRFDQGSSKVDGMISSWHSDSFLMRHMTSRRQIGPAKVASSLQLHLQKPGKGETSPVHVALEDPGVLAIRTRLIADEGRKATGPMVVVDVSRRSQDGIFVTVSPLVRIRNASGLPLQLRCRRGEQKEQGAVVLLEDGDIIDDSMGAFDAIELEGEMKKALLSLNLGNYFLSIRPVVTSPKQGDGESDSGNIDARHDWSDDVKGAKPVRSSGLFDELQYNFRKTVRQNLDTAFGVVFCPAKEKSSNRPSGSDQDSGLHFLIRTTQRKVPFSRPKSEKEQEQREGKYAFVAWQQQQELLLLPTVRVLNLMTSDISVILTSTSKGKKSRSAQVKELQYNAVIPSLGKQSMYMDLGDLVLTVKHEDLDLVSKPVALGVGVKDATKGGNLRDIETDVDFGDGIHTALVTVIRGEDGVLEVMILTKYALQNDSNVTILCCTAKQPVSRWGGLRSARTQEELEWPSTGIVTTVSPKSRVSWFDRSTKLIVKRTESDAEPALLDLESVSKSMEISLAVRGQDSMDNRIQLGIRLHVPSAGDSNPSCVIRFVPRYVVVNDSGEAIVICQDGFQEDTSALVSLGPGERSFLHAQVLPGQKEKNLSGITEAGPELLLTVRFRPKEPGWNWSGPVCAAALGSFSVNIRRSQPGDTKDSSSQKPQKEGPWFAVADVNEEASSLIMTFRQQAADSIPYRLENALRSASIAYKQKGLDDSDLLEAGTTVGYVWDDLSKQHIIGIKLSGSSMQHDINPDKLRSWKSFRSSRRKPGILQIPFLNDLSSMAMYGDDDSDVRKDSKVPPAGYEVYGDGPARVVRICEERDSRVDSRWQSETSRPNTEIEIRIPLFTISVVEPAKQTGETEKEEDSASKAVAYTPVICLRLTNVLIEALITPDYTLCQLKAEGLDVDVKWQGAPLAAMIRGHGQDRFAKGHTVLHMAVVMSNLAKDPIQLKYASILLQAIDFNLDEDTLMKLAPFYRYSLSESTAPSLQIYFERFEIHPIKIVGSFLPGNPHADYSSGQETLRALLHSVIKIPTVRGNTIELNGVLLSNALLTFKQLAIKCAQHYSWYTMRAIYIARGSKLLPPGFASLFDDSAASSLDVFFDPSNGSIDLQGLTVGMFGMLSRGLRNKGQGGTHRYLGNLQHSVKAAGSNLLFAVVTEVSDSVVKGADASGLDGLLSGFRRGVLNVAMKPTVLRGAVGQGGSSRRIKLDRIVGTDEAYIEGYLQAMLDALFKQNYLRVKVIDDQVILKNLPPNTTLMEEIVGCVRNFLIGEGLLAGETSAAALSSLRRLRGEDERRLGPTVIALCEQLLVIIVVRSLRRQTVKLLRQHNILFIGSGEEQPEKPEPAKSAEEDAPKEQQNQGFFHGINFRRALTGFAISSAFAYADGRICRHIPNPLVRRVVSGFLLSFVE